MPRRLPSSLCGDEPDRLLAAARNPRDRAILLLGFFCGLRISEIVGRRVEDLDLDRGMIQVRHGKGDKDRAVPIPAKILAELRAWVGDRREGFVFPGRGGSGHLTRNAVNLSIQAAAARAGITRRCTPHSTRHTYATRLLRTGADIIEVRDLLGHSSVATTSLYLSSDPERLRGAVDRL